MASPVLEDPCISNFLSPTFKVKKSEGEKPGLSGAILAGGESKRMGRDKKYIEIEGKRLIDIAIQKLMLLTADIMVVLHIMEKPLWKYPRSIRLVRDLYSKRSPLVGIHAALFHSNNEKVLIIPVDMPFLPVGTMLDMTKYIHQYRVVVLKTPKGLQPLVGIYSKDLLPMIEEQINEKGLSVKKFLNLLEPNELMVYKVEDIDEWHFKNINTQDDLKDL